MRRWAVAGMAAAVVLAGCLGDDAGDVAPDITHVQDVGRLADGTRVTLVGTALEQDGELRLCAAVMESLPPQCGDPSVRVEGFDLADMQGVQTAEGVTWSQGEVQINGKLVDGVLQAD